MNAFENILYMLDRINKDKLTEDFKHPIKGKNFDILCFLINYIFSRTKKVQLMALIILLKFWELMPATSTSTSKTSHLYTVLYTASVISSVVMGINEIDANDRKLVGSIS